MAPHAGVEEAVFHGPSEAICKCPGGTRARPSCARARARRTRVRPPPHAACGAEGREAQRAPRCAAKVVGGGRGGATSDPRFAPRARARLQVCSADACGLRARRPARRLLTDVSHFLYRRGPESARSLAARAQRCRTRVRLCIPHHSVVLSAVRAAHPQAADDARGVDGTSRRSCVAPPFRVAAAAALSGAKACLRAATACLHRRCAPRHASGVRCTRRLYALLTSVAKLRDPHLR